MKNKHRHHGSRVVPEFQVTTRKTRAGFVPGFYEDESTVELWQVWLHSADGEDIKRATTSRYSSGRRYLKR